MLNHVISLHITLVPAYTLKSGEGDKALIEDTLTITPLFL